jgi:hypothetical protein
MSRAKITDTVNSATDHVADATDHAAYRIPNTTHNATHLSYPPIERPLPSAAIRA